MRTKIMIGAAILVCAGAAAVFYYFKKKNDLQTEVVKRNTEDCLPTKELTKSAMSEQDEDFAAAKEAVVESITDRHQEAGQYIRQTVNNILEGRMDSEETKNADKLKSISDKLNKSRE